MDERPGEKQPEEGGIEGALATSSAANSTAFGYSIMITVTFGVLTRVQDQGSVLDLFLFATAAALGVGVINAVVTRGFRRRLRQMPAEIAMLGTAMNVVSVTGAVAVALAAAESLPEQLGWAAASFASSAAYVLIEALEILLAERIQARRGDPEADP